MPILHVNGPHFVFIFIFCSYEPNAHQPDNKLSQILDLLISCKER